MKYASGSHWNSHHENWNKKVVWVKVPNEAVQDKSPYSFQKFEFSHGTG
jgi:hypothetical protein